MVLNSLPLKLNCSKCENILLEAFLTIDTEDEASAKLIVETVDMCCNKCKHKLLSAIDDLTREQELQWPSELP